MRKLISLIIAVMGLTIGLIGCSCGHNDTPPPKHKRSAFDHYKPPHDIRLRKTSQGDCQYVIWEQGSSIAISHAGDCNNPRHEENWYLED